MPTPATAPRATTPRPGTASTSTTRPAAKPSSTVAPAAKRPTTTTSTAATTTPAKPRSTTTPSATSNNTAAAATARLSRPTPKPAAASPKPGAKPATATGARTTTPAATSSSSSSRTPAAPGGKTTPKPTATATGSARNNNNNIATTPSPKGKTGSRNVTPSPKGKRATTPTGAGSAAAAGGGRRSSPAASSAVDGSIAGANGSPPSNTSSPKNSEPAAAAREPSEPKMDPEVVELRTTVATKRKELNQIEREIQAMTHLLKAQTATERADGFRSKSTEIMVDVRKMKKEIDALRHADRALGSLKDTLETMNRHTRMRTAHIRQKRATIALMEQRAKEYAGHRRQMVFDLADVIKDAHELSKQYEGGETFAVTVDPWAALKTMVSVDDQRESVLVHSVKRIGHHDKDHVDALQKVIAAQRELATSVNQAADATAADLRQVLEDWDDERIDLEQQIAQKEKTLDEVQHHLHRGTNFMWTSQLQREDLRPLRELKLASDQHQAKLHMLQREAVEIEKACRDEETNIGRDVEEVDAKINDAGDMERKLLESNEELRRQYRELQAQYPTMPAVKMAVPLLDHNKREASTSPNKFASPSGNTNNNPAAASPTSPTSLIASPLSQSTRSKAIKKKHTDPEWTGPSFMRPTSSRKQREQLEEKSRVDATERSKEFRSRKPTVPKT